MCVNRGGKTSSGDSSSRTADATYPCDINDIGPICLATPSGWRGEAKVDGLHVAELTWSF